MEELGLQVDDDGLGTTGVILVDSRHFQIRNLTQQKAISMARRIRDTARAGDERFRCIPKWFQRPILERFLLLPDEEVIAEAKRRCRERVVCKMSPDLKGRTPNQIIKGLESNKPAMPRFRIERAAYLNYCDRIETGRSGSAEDDWIKAENGLREAYKDAFR
jgi:hypothetical protein